MPNNTINWGQAAVQNNNGFGAGSSSSNSGWGSVHAISYGHDETNLVGLIRTAPVNTIAPLLSGTFEVGQVVSCNTGTWSGTTPITYAYQWKLDGVDIVGETASTYTIVLADDTKSLTCLVTATNAIGSASQLSNAWTVGSNWLLNGGIWNDTGVWEDTAVWID